MFTELIKQIGVRGVQVDELATLEDDELRIIKYTIPLGNSLDLYMG